SPLAIPAGDVVELEYHFSDGPSPDGFAAWQTGVEGNCYRFAVLADCRGLGGGFRQQALNRYFARIVQKHRIDRVLVRDCHGCTLDLVRIADLMHIPTLIQLPPASPLPAAGDTLDNSGAGDNSLVDTRFCDSSGLARRWLADSLGRARLLLHEGPQPPAWLADVAPEARVAPLATLAEHLAGPVTEAGSTAATGADGGFDYAIYEFTQRDHPLLMQMQAGEVRHFADCRRVLDLGCGAGIFLQLLAEAGIAASGVERDPVIAAYGRGMGLDITTADALDYLRRAGEQAAPVYDGVYCSHFVEHLPVEVVQMLLERLARLLPPGGTLVLAFPDPESIRSQLLGFWRDPEHVRFYHPELVATLAGAHGFDLEWSSYHDQPHEVVPFALAPPPLAPVASPALTDIDSGSGAENGWWQRVLAALGLVPARDHRDLARQVDRLQVALGAALDQQHRAIAALVDRTDQLWAVNRTWAWNDNAVLKLRKRG
ncbi:MAG: class I SAM-dependent methyltransferase, partial [Porticoccaceae bacterium]